MNNEVNIPLEEDGIEEEILVDEEVAITKAMWGDIGGDMENQTDLQNALDAKQDSLTEAQLNAVNSGITSEKVTTYDGYADQIASKADQSALNAEATTREQADTALGRRIDDEATARQQADNGLQTQIDAITSKSDVVDVVANYAALQAYDTSTLGNNDVIKVLDDETHEDALTYYRWSTTTQTWSYIGQEAPYYSKGQMNVKLAEKQDKLTEGANIKIENNVISATDTTYTAGNGLNLNDGEFSADTTVLATKEDLESYYTKTETDNLLAPKLETEVVAELPTTGTEGKLYLTPKAHTTQTATGNPITATVTEDAGKIESFQLDGDTFQQSYTGKNLIATTRIAPQTQNGVTCTWDGASFTLDGTSTASADFYGRGWWGATSDPIALPAGTYTMSLRKSDGSFATDADFSVNCYYGTTHIIGIYKGQSGAGYKTETFDSDTQYAVLYISLPSGRTYNNEKFYIQLEKSESPTTYEPFVGGQPSPSPSYPQPIQTVTGLQTVEIVGKNLFDISKADMMVARLNASGGITLEITNRLCTRGYIEVKPSTTYTLNALSETIGETLQAYIIGYSESGSGTAIENYPTNAWYSFPITFTTGSNCRFIRISYRYSDDSTMATTSAVNQQLELGSTATAYTAFSSTDYPISLGDIELCKLGTYQDYIWKDGEDWKVHKAVGKAELWNGTNWRVLDTTITGEHRFSVKVSNTDTPTSDSSGTLVNLNSDYWSACTRLQTYQQTQGIATTGASDFSTESFVAFVDSIKTSDVDGWKAWLATNKPVVYYQSTAPTDITITDTTLITQLEAIRTASLENGTNTITNTATGTNLAGDMEIGYFEFNPTNRYDKFIWLNLNNNYEQIGGE